MEDNGRLIKHEINVKTAFVYDGRSACCQHVVEESREQMRARGSALACLPFPSYGRDSISRKAN